MTVQADSASTTHSSSVVDREVVATPAGCLPNHQGFLRARLNGSVDAELDWRDQELDCAGSIRPGGIGLRLRFSAVHGSAAQRLVLLFGVSNIREGENAQALPVNLTIIREGLGEFYATQGDGRCTADEVRQEPLRGWPLKERSWRVQVRGFCVQPARALQGKGAILVSRFDFAGIAEFTSEPAGDSMEGVAAR